MTKAQHTPTPWHIESVATSAYSARVFICDANGSRVTDINCGDDDAKFIVKACNAHDALVEALQALMRLDVKGHQLQDRLQFSDAGRDLLKKCDIALKLAREG